MKLMFITDNFPPEVNAPASRTYEHCREWVKSGVDVTVITCAPNFPKGKVYKGYKNKLYQTEVLDGIKVIRVWSYISANKGFTKRVLDFLSFAFSSFFAGLFIKTDIIIATSPQFFTTWSGCLLSKIKRKPWIFELRDLWPDSIRTVGTLDKEKVLDFFEKIELFLYKDADLIISVTNSFKKNLIKRGIESDKIKIVTNGVDLDFYKDIKKDVVLLSSLGLDDKFIVGYIGTHGMAHSLDFIVNSIACMDDEDIHFLFIGDGAKKEEIVILAKNLKLENITFLDSVAKEKIPSYLSIIDVSLTPLKKSDVFKTVIPSKIFEASAMLKPILLGVEGEARDIIERYDSGICFEPENKDEFIKQVLKLKHDKKLYEKLQEGCKEMSISYNRKSLAHNMLNNIKIVVQEKEDNV